MKSVVIILIGVFAAIGAFAQNKGENIDVVFLKNGKHHAGEIIIYEQGEELLLKEEDGTRIRIPDSKILKILQGLSRDELASMVEENAPPPELLEVRTSGLYNNTMLSFAIGEGGESSLALGAGLSTVLGYQFKPFLGVGLGIGIDNYARRGETLYPIFAEVRGFIPSKKKPNTYYLVFAGGYGMAFKRESIGVREAQGGYMLHPSIGYRTATREGVDVNVDIGVKWQKAEFQHDLFNGDVRVRDLVFQRFTIRVGLTLWK
jgi:hypothetical protein